MTTLGEMKDKTVDDFFLTHSLFQPFGLVALYLVFVTKLGPTLMKNREPMKLNHVIFVYNLIQIFSNGYLAVMFWLNLKNVSLLCTNSDSPTSVESMSLLTVQHRYVLLKLVDLVETIVFVLRKKNNQVSFLHVFHHGGLVLVSWISLNYAPGGPHVLSGYINCCVHVVMYLYYLLSTWMERKQLWWKKYITILQVGGNCMLLVNYVVHLLNPYCSFPKWNSLMLVLYILVVLYLFAKFYKESYVKKQVKLQ
ncbi:hypothetical protein Zmor_025991 [Zophobas morio]|uniref:Elongation of very long chain fatty acids protein n=1 Tax=Zophobas morio TaxID=2755281 RepID=A0AA38M4R1_9CUCU|nr:hypothetical protein Zmor_025991 [Zophobas morio]